MMVDDRSANMKMYRRIWRTQGHMVDIQDQLVFGLKIAMFERIGDYFLPPQSEGDSQVDQVLQRSSI